jgi:hypothetical protein
MDIHVGNKDTGWSMIHVERVDSRTQPTDG